MEASGTRQIPHDRWESASPTVRRYLELFTNLLIVRQLLYGS